MSVYYNDSDAFVCAWLRNLIEAKLLPAGDVDERPIEQVQASDVAGYTQCHFFAGIGGWPYALHLAGWGDRPVWTGSCPCQPFSAAGRQQGHRDHRHLWPEWFRLIRERRPDTIFGEQVGNAVGLGWLDAVRADLEAEAYSVGACVLGAHSVGSPHVRQRFWFVADADAARCGAGRTGEAGDGRVAPRQQPPGFRALGELADPERDGCGPRGSEREGQRRRIASNGASAASELADADGGQPRNGDVQRSRDDGQFTPYGRAGSGSAVQSPWDCEWLPCQDGKSRPVEPGTFPLAHGIPQRVGRLRAYGNAIVPQVAAAFVSAYMEIAP